MSLIVVGVSALLDTRTLVGLTAAVFSGMATYLLLNANVLRELKNERFA